MKNQRNTVTTVFAVILLLGTVQTGSAEDYQKIAQSGFQFLSVINDGQAAALGGAMTAREMNSEALFFNPAGMANMTRRFDLALSRNPWLADITHNAFSLAFNPAGGRYGVVGISVQAVDYGKIIGTIVADVDDAYLETGLITASAQALGLGYARAISDRFSVGGQVKWTRQDFGDLVAPATATIDSISDSTITPVHYRLNPVAVDFGTLFRTGIKSLAFGMSVRNFSQEISYIEEGFQLPLAFTIGLSFDFMDLIAAGNSHHSLLVSTDATHYRSRTEQLKIGVDYRFMQLLSLRVGYANNEESGLTCGIGVAQSGFKVDYSYTPYGLFGSVQIITVRFAL